MTAPERPRSGAGEAGPLNVVGSAGEPNPSVAAPTTQYAVRTSRGFLVTFACLGNAAMAAEQCGGQLLSAPSQNGSRSLARTSRCGHD